MIIHIMAAEHHVILDMEYKFINNPEEEWMNAEADRDFIRMKLEDTFRIIFQEEVKAVFEDEMR